MNKLLPKIEDLEPITDNSKTFYDSGFNQKFDLLPFEKQLQIINDIVRQSMIYSKFPNPFNEKNTLIGDAYTAALVSVDYLKQLKIGTNHRIVFARKKPFENDSTSSKQVVVLLEDNDNNTYFFDATPIVDYKSGYVNKGIDKLYNDYILINGELKKVYDIIRKLKYECYTKKLNVKEIEENLEVLNCALKYDFLIKDIEEICSLVNYNEFNIINKIEDKRLNILSKDQRNKIIKYLKELNTELKDLISSDTNYKRQIELAQLITKLTNTIESKSEKIYDIGGNKYIMSQLSPRLFLDNGLNLIMIKPSAYIFNWENEVKNLFLDSNYKSLGEYKGGLGYDSDLGLKRMRLFHPHGYKYERSMAGPTDIFLVERTAAEIGEIKRVLRQEYKKRVKEKEVNWFDNKVIEWNPICLNFAHSSDDPCEACMGYTAMFPEYQLMTRFMYPNPILIKEEKNGRIRI